MLKNINNMQLMDIIRRDDYNNISFEGAEVIAEYLTSLENSIDMDIELDVVKIRINFNEVEGTEKEIQEYLENNYFIDDIEIIEVEETENYKKIIINTNEEGYQFYKRI